jgi:hypothetical protein
VREPAALARESRKKQNVREINGLQLFTANSMQTEIERQPSGEIRFGSFHTTVTVVDEQHELEGRRSFCRFAFVLMVSSRVTKQTI